MRRYGTVARIIGLRSRLARGRGARGIEWELREALTFGKKVAAGAGLEEIRFVEKRVAKILFREAPAAMKRGRVDALIGNYGRRPAVATVR